MEMFLNIVPVLGIAALLFAALLAARVSRQNAGTDKMKEIACLLYTSTLCNQQCKLYAGRPQSVFGVSGRGKIETEKNPCAGNTFDRRGQRNGKDRL